MKGVCLTPQPAGVDLTAIILSCLFCLFHLFVTVAAVSRGKGGCYAGILHMYCVLFLLELSNLRMKRRRGATLLRV